MSAVNYWRQHGLHRPPPRSANRPKRRATSRHWQTKAVIDPYCLGRWATTTGRRPSPPHTRGNPAKRATQSQRTHAATKKFLHTINTRQINKKRRMEQLYNKVARLGCYFQGRTWRTGRARGLYNAQSNDAHDERARCLFGS